MNDIISSTNNASSMEVSNRAAGPVNNNSGLKESSIPVVTPPVLNVPTPEEVFAAADQVTAFLRENNSSRALRLSMDEYLDRAVFTIVDSETNEVVRHIPSDEVIAMARHIEEWIPDIEETMPQGIMFDGLV